MTPSDASARWRLHNPKGELRRFEPVPDDVVLAATGRAEHHREREGEGATGNDILAHLGFAHSASTMRRLWRQLDALVAASALVRSDRHGLSAWALTDNGHARIARARQAGEVLLPEAPQHRAWRHAREEAGKRIDGFLEHFRRALNEADGLLDAEHADSDTWLVLAERLRQTCWQVGSAIYCLDEWVEPDDACADIDNWQAPDDDALDIEQQDRRREARRHRRDPRRWEPPLGLREG